MDMIAVDQSTGTGQIQFKAVYPVEKHSSSMPSPKEFAICVLNKPVDFSYSGNYPILANYLREDNGTEQHSMSWGRDILDLLQTYFTKHPFVSSNRTSLKSGQMFTDSGTSETVSLFALEEPWLHSDALDLDPLNITRQLEEMKALEDGWADGVQLAINWGEGYGKAPKPKGLDWLAEQFNTHYAHDLQRPYLYPTPEGGVQAEWSLGPNEISLEIDLARHSAEWLCFNLRTERSDERILKLDDETEWRWIDRRLRQLGATVE